MEVETEIKLEVPASAHKNSGSDPNKEASEQPMDSTPNKRSTKSFQNLEAEALIQKPAVEKSDNYTPKPTTTSFFTLLLIVSWYSSNIGVLLLNKYLLSNYGFKYPVFLTMCHMIACSILSYICIIWFKVMPYQVGRSSFSPFFWLKSPNPISLYFSQSDLALSFLKLRHLAPFSAFL